MTYYVLRQEYLLSSILLVVTVHYQMGCILFRYAYPSLFVILLFYGARLLFRWDELKWYGVQQCFLLFAFMVLHLVKTYYRELGKRKALNKLRVMESEIKKTDTLLNHLVPSYVL